MGREALIFNIYRGSTSDGEGIRDTVFFKGCPLKCLWCHNPEGIPFQNDVWWEQGKCAGCGKCVEACTNECISFEEDGMHMNKEKCEHCFRCTDACRYGAMQRIAEEFTVSQLCELIMKDKEYFEVSGGGVTASGGEAMCQFEFVLEFFKIMRENGINTALDTTGFCDTAQFKEIMKYTDTLLYDIKTVDDAEHIRLTGKSNRRIIENLKVYRDTMGEKPRLWIRTPIIPNMTDTEKNISDIANFIRDDLRGCAQCWELCAFNNSCIGKYQKLFLNWELKNEKLLSKDKMEKLTEIAKKSGIKKVMYTGIIKNEER